MVMVILLMSTNDSGASSSLGGVGGRIVEGFVLWPSEDELTRCQACRSVSRLGPGFGLHS